MKYFLYVYQPDVSEEFNMSQESDLGNSSIECEAEQTKDGGWYFKHSMAAKHCIPFHQLHLTSLPLTIHLYLHVFTEWR